MEQLVVEITSEKDAVLIKELLKKFKGVEVNDFSTTLKPAQIQKRIEHGIADADSGNVKPWKDVKAKLLKQIKSKAK